MSSEMSLRRWQEEYAKGTFDGKDVRTQIDAGWYDWFCSDTSLANKTARMGKVIAKLKDSDKVDLDQTYVFFKNNCPMVGPLYDDFRLCYTETGDVQYMISYKEPWDKQKHMWNVHAICEGLVEDENGVKEFKKYQFKTTKDLVEWFNERS